METDTPKGRLYLSPDAILGMQSGVKNCLKMFSEQKLVVAIRERVEHVDESVETSHKSLQRCTRGVKAPVRLTGTLTKRSTRTGFAQTRWFELNGSRLYYYKLYDGEPRELCQC